MTIYVATLQIVSKIAFEDNMTKEQIAKNMQKLADKYSLLNNILVTVIFIIGFSLSLILTIMDFFEADKRIPELDYFMGCFLIFDSIIVLVPAIILIVLINKLGKTVFR